MAKKLTHKNTMVYGKKGISVVREEVPPEEFEDEQVDMKSVNPFS